MSRTTSQRRCFEGSAIVPANQRRERRASQAKGSACPKAQRHTGFHEERVMLEGRAGLDQTGPFMEANFILTEPGSLWMVSRRLSIHFSVREDTTYKPGAQEPDHLCFSMESQVLTSWVTLGSLLSFLEPRCSPGQNDDNNSTNLIGLPQRLRRLNTYNMIRIVPGRWRALHTLAVSSALVSTPALSRRG